MKKMFLMIFRFLIIFPLFFVAFQYAKVWMLHRYSFTSFKLLLIYSAREIYSFFFDKSTFNEHYILLSVLVFVIYLFLCIFVYRIYKFFFPLSDYQMQQLGYDLMMGFKEKSNQYQKQNQNIPEIIYPRVRLMDDHVEVECLNPLKTEEEINSQLEQFSNVLENKFEFTYAKKVIKNRKTYYRFFIKKEIEKIELATALEKLSLDPLQIYLGRNINTNQDVIINQQEYSAIYVQGSPGAGKSVLIQSILEQFFRLNSDYQIIVATTKPMDFNFCRTLNKYKERVLILDMQKKESFEKLLDCFSKVNELEREADEFVFKNRINNPEDHKVSVLTTKYNFASTSKYFFIFDEAADFLKIEKTDLKEKKDLKSNLIDVTFTHIRRTARFCSCPILVCSQVEKAEQIDLDLSKFNLRICSRTNKAMSSILMSDASALDKPELTCGLFAIRLKDGIHYIKTPFFNPEVKNNIFTKEIK